MIKQKITVVFSAIALLLSTVIIAQKKEKLEFIKERAISKTYAVSGSSFSIENSFGQVKVIAWDKNEIKVDIAIKVESSDKDVAERTFANIDVTDSETNNKIRFKTEQKSNDGDGCKNCSTNMQINYEVHMPVTVNMTITNSFGSIEVPDYKGPISLISKFGRVTAGALAEVKYLTVEFGKAQLKSISDVTATFKFSKVQIENLSGANKISMEFCDSSKIVLSSDLNSLSVNESYSTINLRPASGLDASYDIRTNFGSFIDRTNIGVERTDTPDRYGADSNRHYEGKSGNGNTKVTIKSTFGKIILGEAKPEDMKKGSKSSSRNAGKVI